MTDYSRQKRYYDKNRLNIAVKQKAVRILNVEKISEYNNQYYQNITLPKRRKLQELRKLNKLPKSPEKIRLSKLKKKIRQMRYMCRIRGAIGSHTFEEWEEVKKKYNYRCAMCKGAEPFLSQKIQCLTEDHIIPIIKGGSNFIDNIQPLCHKCNCIKKDKILDNCNIPMLISS